jgi:hypothetical protein
MVTVIPFRATGTLIRLRGMGMETWILFVVMAFLNWVRSATVLSLEMLKTALL